ncbi:MAG: tetratricopeptide repeat protein [Brevinemataceae bacterium]
MKKIILFLVLVNIAPSFVHSQNVYPNYIEDDAYSLDALNRLYIIGLQYLNNGDLTQAEISFRSITAFPYRSKDWRTVRYYKGKSHFYLGDIYFLQERFDKSISNYQNVAQEYGEIEEYSNAIFKLGRSLILGKKEAEGIEVLRDYNYNYGSSEGLADNALYWIARGYMGLENYTAALKILNQILRDFPQSPMGYDIRNLIAKLETDYAVQPSSQQISIQKDTLQETINNSQLKAEKIEKEKELVDRIKQILTIKEQLLIIKERKLELLDNIGKLRTKILNEKDRHK